MSIVCVLSSVWLLLAAVCKSIASKGASPPPVLGGLSAAEADKASLIRLTLPILLLVLLLVKACCLVDRTMLKMEGLLMSGCSSGSLLLCGDNPGWFAEARQQHSNRAGDVPFLALQRERSLLSVTVRRQSWAVEEDWKRCVLHSGGVERSTQGMPERWAEKTVHQQES